MEDSLFDSFVRRLGGAGSRRPLLGAFAALGASAARSLDGEARHKKKKGKKKKKHKKGNGTTTSTTTKAPPACPEDQKLCGGSCIDAVLCCDDDDCAADQTCLGAGGICVCNNANTITCGQLCCDKASEVCRMNGDDTSCVAGACPSTNFCAAINDAPQYVCANGPTGSCVCTNTVDASPQPACVSGNAIFACDPSGPVCGNSSQCPLGSVCINKGANCGDCPTTFCVPLCTA